MNQSELNAVITLRNEVSPWLSIVQVVPDGWTFPDYLPGQYTTLGLFGSAPRCALAEAEPTPPPADKLIRRAYSLVSSPLNREYMEFYLNLVPGGVLTPRLFTLKIGDRIWLSQRVTGSFTFDSVPEDANVVLIANGSGLAPYISMLTTHLRFLTQRRVAVMHGVRHSCDLAYRSILTTMTHLRTNFTYLPIISRPQQEPVPWTGESGHVQDLWKNGALERAWGSRPGPENTHIFLCGSPDMIEEMVAMLAQEGFAEIREKKPGQIHVERYWPKSSTAGSKSIST